jgi:hypothetical protein
MTLLWHCLWEIEKKLVHSCFTPHLKVLSMIDDLETPKQERLTNLPIISTQATLDLQ